jgi:hypothetical protein
VASANVTLTNVSTNAKRRMKSTDTGEYVFDLITPGDYRLEVEAKGFNKKVLDNVRALIGKATESDVQLGIGATNTIRIRAREASDHGRKIPERTGLAWTAFRLLKSGMKSQPTPNNTRTDYGNAGDFLCSISCFL